MPTENIKYSERKAVVKWIMEQGGESVTSLNDGMFGSAGYMVDDEPVIIKAIKNPGAKNLLEEFMPEGWTLFCTKNQAEALEKAGIVSLREKVKA